MGIRIVRIVRMRGSVERPACRFVPLAFCPGSVDVDAAGLLLALGGARSLMEKSISLPQGTVGGIVPYLEHRLEFLTSGLRELSMSE